MVVIGDLIGEGEVRERGIVGETPNLAARLQALAEPQTVLIADSTRRLTGGLFDYEDRGPVEIKGFSVPLNGRAGVARERRSRVGSRRCERRHAADRPRRRNGAVAAPVGTGQRRRGLCRAGLRRAGHWQIAPRAGSARKIAGEPHTRLRLSCSPHQQDSALYPTITQLERAAGFRREDTAEDRLDKLEAVLADTTLDIGEAAPLLAALLSHPGRRALPAAQPHPADSKREDAANAGGPSGRAGGAAAGANAV